MTEYRTIAAPATASFVEKKSEFIAYLALSAQRGSGFSYRNRAEEPSPCQTQRIRLSAAEGNASLLPMTANHRALPACQFWTSCKKRADRYLLCGDTVFRRCASGQQRLVRAYSHSTSLAIEQAKVQIMLPCYPVSLQADYSLYGKIAYALRKQISFRKNVTFEDQVRMKLLVDTILPELQSSSLI